MNVGTKAQEAIHGDLVTCWFETHHQELYHYLLRLTGDESLAADLVQESFLRALVALERDGQPDNPPAWLHRIGTNLALSALKRRNRWRWLPLTSHEPATSFTSEVVTADLVRRCLLRLKPAEVEALLLYEWVGLSCAEIAALTQETAVAIRTRLSRARVRFHHWYTHEVQDEL